jgi:hypothetical protein
MVTPPRGYRDNITDGVLSAAWCPFALVPSHPVTIIFISISGLMLFQGIFVLMQAYYTRF